ncbi:DUF1330 domain-containing protein [Sulfitobacter donghicola]|uniref:DUF1330 domain-containing protein n=1 Tax=Sulfitobacter donghicola DSW-25 = KCTC 12864 = JCM 14565 TaxID=1300350 RepID=A0A073IF34_9RHOB|nr:DUF1330 domain-containing protein [Sulfitobacter donghicola]KEJ88076.1 hypothetical protein DSW25_17555 [Sulfitobacter donghicola DSW-25 = KCTC 12864 = JCM 14565]KIN68705.1 hypothetical protein Z948_2436 [Sulfitobacter donghicola DSW-25 = KCTC 12864 = JCM 14565]
MTRFTDTNREQFEQFKSLDRNSPINMINLVQFHDVAQYPAEHPLAADALTGAQAYKNYGAASGPIMQRVGGKIIWRGDFDLTLIGDASEVWDAMFIVQYPTAAAFLEMVTNPEYQRAVVHRQAAVLNSRLIRSRPLEVSETFE